MGQYINPEDGSSKEQWLSEHAEEIPEDNFMCIDFNDIQQQGKWPVVWVNNGQFTAAMVCHVDREFKYVLGNRKNDIRPMKFYVAPIDVLTPFIKI